MSEHNEETPAYQIVDSVWQVMHEVVEELWHLSIFPEKATEESLMAIRTKLYKAKNKQLHVIGPIRQLEETLGFISKKVSKIDGQKRELNRRIREDYF